MFRDFHAQVRGYEEPLLFYGVPSLNTHGSSVKITSRIKVDFFQNTSKHDVVIFVKITLLML